MKQERVVRHNIELSRDEIVKILGEYCRHELGIDVNGKTEISFILDDDDNMGVFITNREEL